MAKRTFATIWQQIEKLHNSLVEGKKEPSKIDETIQELLAKPDVIKIIAELGQLLMLEYDGFTEIGFEFICNKEEESFIRPSFYDSKKKIIFMDPFKLLSFAKLIKSYAVDMPAEADFEKYRKNSFLAEASKLPNKSILFLCVLQQVAISDGLTHIGLSEIPQGELSDTSFYQTVLWAFNELEKKLYTLNGINIRTEFNISWHESEWISI
jgi:hypothetical protein